MAIHLACLLHVSDALEALCDSALAKAVRGSNGYLAKKRKAHAPRPWSVAIQEPRHPACKRPNTFWSEYLHVKLDEVIKTINALPNM